MSLLGILNDCQKYDIHHVKTFFESYLFTNCEVFSNIVKPK